MNEGRQITKEQAEACMRDDGLFKVHWLDKVYTLSSGLICYWEGSETKWVPSTAWKDDSWWAYEKTATIHADPKNTFERLFGDDRELTFEEAWAALGRGETVLGRQGDAIQDCYFLFKFEHKDGGGPRIVYGNANKFGEKQTKDWSGRFVGFDLVTFVKPNQLEPSPQPEPLTLEERVEALDARLKALEAKS